MKIYLVKKIIANNRLFLIEYVNFEMSSKKIEL